MHVPCTQIYDLHIVICIFFSAVVGILSSACFFFFNIWILVKRIRVLPTYFVHMMCHHVVCNNFSGSKIGIFSHKIAIECWLRSASALATNDDDDDNVMMMMLIWLASSRCSLLLASHAKCEMRQAYFVIIKRKMRISMQKIHAGIMFCFRVEFESTAAESSKKSFNFYEIFMGQ